MAKLLIDSNTPVEVKSSLTFVNGTKSTLIKHDGTNLLIGDSLAIAASDGTINSKRNITIDSGRSITIFNTSLTKDGLNANGTTLIKDHLNFSTDISVSKVAEVVSGNTLNNLKISAGTGKIILGNNVELSGNLALSGTLIKIGSDDRVMKASDFVFDGTTLTIDKSTN